MKLVFLLKEGFSCFTRARLATAISILSITLSLALVGLFGLIVQNLSTTFNRIYQKINLEVFVDPSLSDAQVNELQQRLTTIQGIESIRFVSRAEALEEFSKDFGEDLVGVLTENPLPPSLRVLLESGYTDIVEVEKVVGQIESFQAVDDVVYQENIIRFLNRYALVGGATAAAIGAAIIFICTMLIFNTIRLAIHGRQTIIEIMRLVGATNFFIKAPFIIEGILQGLIGSVLASALLWVFSDMARAVMFTSMNVPTEYFVVLIIGGILLGLMGSYISVGKYLSSF